MNKSKKIKNLFNINNITENVPLNHSVILDIDKYLKENKIKRNLKKSEKEKIEKEKIEREKAYTERGSITSINNTIISDFNNNNKNNIIPTININNEFTTNFTIENINTKENTYLTDISLSNNKLPKLENQINQINLNTSNNKIIEIENEYRENKELFRDNKERELSPKRNNILPMNLNYMGNIPSKEERIKIEESNKKKIPFFSNVFRDSAKKFILNTNPGVGHYDIDKDRYGNFLKFFNGKFFKFS